MVTVTKGKLLRAVLVILAVAILPAFGSTLSAQVVCSPNDPCYCSGCCLYLQEESFQCPYNEGGGYCFFATCVQGQGGNQAANSYCELCCIGNYSVQDWYTAGGSCTIASPVRKSSSTELEVEQPFFVRGCGRGYSVITISVAG